MTDAHIIVFICVNNVCMYVHTYMHSVKPVTVYWDSKPGAIVLKPYEHNK